MCVVSLVDVDRQFFKSNTGLSCDECSRNASFCAYVVLPYSPDVFVVLNSSLDPRFDCMPDFSFYAGAAIVVNGQKIGSFCILDSQPHSQFTDSDKADLLDFAAIISQMITLRRDKQLLQEMSHSQRLLKSLRHNLLTPMFAMDMSLQNVSGYAISSVPDSSPITSDPVTQSARDILATLQRQCSSLRDVTTAALAVGECVSLFAPQTNTLFSVNGENESHARGRQRVATDMMNVCKNLKQLLIKINTRHIPFTFTVRSESDFMSGVHACVAEVFIMVALNKVGNMLLSSTGSVQVEVWFEANGHSEDMERNDHAVAGAIHMSAVSSAGDLTVDMHAFTKKGQVPTLRMFDLDNWSSDVTPGPSTDSSDGASRMLSAVSGGFSSGGDGEYHFWLPCDVGDYPGIISSNLSTVSGHQTSMDNSLALSRDTLCAIPVHAPRYRILIMDADSGAVRRLRCNLMSRFQEQQQQGKGSVDIKVSLNGAEGCELFLKALEEEKPFDVVFVNLLLPVKNGLRCVTDISGAIESHLHRLSSISSSESSGSWNGFKEPLIVGILSSGTQFHEYIDPSEDAESDTSSEQLCDPANYGFGMLLEQPLDNSLLGAIVENLCREYSSPTNYENFVTTGMDERKEWNGTLDKLPIRKGTKGTMWVRPFGYKRRQNKVLPVEGIGDNC